MTTLERLSKYPTSHYDPKLNCKHCGGTGERFVQKLNLKTCCICIFVAHDVCEEIGTQIGNIAKQELQKYK